MIRLLLALILTIQLAMLIRYELAIRTTNELNQVILEQNTDILELSEAALSYNDKILSYNKGLEPPYKKALVK